MLCIWGCGWIPSTLLVTFTHTWYIQSLHMHILTNCPIAVTIQNLYIQWASVCEEALYVEVLEKHHWIPVTHISDKECFHSEIISLKVPSSTSRKAPILCEWHSELHALTYRTSYIWWCVHISQDIAGQQWQVMFIQTGLSWSDVDWECVRLCL